MCSPRFHFSSEVLTCRFEMSASRILAFLPEVTPFPFTPPVIRRVSVSLVFSLPVSLEPLSGLLGPPPASTISLFPFSLRDSMADASISPLRSFPHMFPTQPKPPTVILSSYRFYLPHGVASHSRKENFSRDLPLSLSAINPLKEVQTLRF